MVRASRSVKDQSPLPPIDVEALQIRLGGRSLSGNNYGAERKQAAFRERAALCKLFRMKFFAGCLQCQASRGVPLLRIVIPNT